MSANIVSRPEKDGSAGLGDLEKTVILNTLMSVPFSERDQKWRDVFLDSLPEANLKLGNPEVVIAGDGFPYVQLETVNPNENFQAYVISKQLPTLLSQGFGIIINPQHDRLDWVLSYGDIVNYELNDSFYTDTSIFSNSKENIAVGKDEKILIGQPADSILPKYLRAQLKEYLLHMGVKVPKIMLIARNYEDENLVSQDLIFNLTPVQFRSEKVYHEIMAAISWFLPKHYSFMGVDEMAITNGFQAL
ncbi:hypothetical protein [Sphingobacterium pedocola]|uniref:SseB protein N-terminal domain-containing protein n=1 Tax=Sphingobacterium pedocola TaxID=2082722 RepID=A0ABR9TAS1_9SPHI|nr:hypothetical protein [Sphingobacterium pedocola]MBE8722433.1 hypothetical protein [Sphingobacterium pedocola]